MSFHLDLPKAGHIEKSEHILGYLEHESTRRILLYPDNPNTSEYRFSKFDWEDFYRGEEAPIHVYMTNPRGKSMFVHISVYAYHDGNRVSRRS